MFSWDLRSLVWPLSLLLTNSFNKILSYCHLKISLSILFRLDSLLTSLSVNQKWRKSVRLKWPEITVISFLWSLVFPCAYSKLSICRPVYKISNYWVILSQLVFYPLKPFRHLSDFRFTLKFNTKNCTYLVFLFDIFLCYRVNTNFLRE